MIFTAKNDVHSRSSNVENLYLAGSEWRVSGEAEYFHTLLPSSEVWLPLTLINRQEELFLLESLNIQLHLADLA